jgi:uncharacterized membrane protein
MITAFLEIAALQPPWLQGWMVVLAGLGLVIFAGLAWLIVLLVQDELHARQRAREEAAAAIRYTAQRDLQLRLRTLVEDERRRQLAAAAHPEPTE